MMRPWAFPLVAAVFVASTVIVAGPVASGPASAQPPVVEVPAVNVVSWADDPWLAATDRLILVPLLGPLTTAGAVRFDELLGVAPTQIFTMGDGQSQVYSLGEEVSLDEARARGAALVAEGFAARAEPDYRVRRASAPVNDPLWDDQWHLATVSATNYGIDVAGLWARTTGSASVVVAVLDSGITDHPDLNSRNIPVADQSYPYGYDMISLGGGVDPRDGDGRDPDPTDEGDWQAAGECGQESGSKNSSWHGTHVAGTIGAATNNGVGVAGVDQQARLIHVRVLGKCGGYISDVADGIRWAAGLQVGALPLNTHPARVINMSLGGFGACAPVGQDAVTAAIAAGAIVIAAAGNNNALASGFSPANCDGVITVAASIKGGARAAYSNYGARVDIAAPGGDESGSVLSTSNEGTTESASFAYTGLFGTSQAAPHVAGVVALILSLSPTLTASEVRTLLRATVTPFPNPTDEDIGPGILNAGALFVGPPTNVAATEGEPGSATVTWVAAPSPGETLIGYLATPHLAGVAQPSLARSVGSAATAVTFDTLTNGTAYTFVVESLYSDDNRYASIPSNEVTPYDVPDAPTGVALQPSDGGVQVNWTAPNFNGGRAITGYEVAVTQVGAAITVTVTVPATSTSALVTGLTNGASYTATVGATNAAGTGAAGIAAATAQPLGVPGAPTGVVAARGNPTVTGRVSVTWTAAAANGANVTYVARAVQDPSKSCTTAALTCNITGLPTYVALTFEVVASNSEGVGPVAAASTGVTLMPSLPASPREATGVNAGSVASGTVASGSSASISVGGFDQFEWVAIVVQSTPQMLSAMQADAAGTVSTTVNVPSGLSIGTHYLTVLSDVRTDGTRRGVTQSFSVADSAPSNPGTGGGGGGGAPIGTTFPAERFAGADRYSTSVEISRANFNPGVAVVYLATGANFADALAAGAAAGGAGPVLLVERTRVPTSTLTELGRLQPRHIVVLGGTAAIAESVVGAVRALATESTIRLGGADRFETAALVSAATFSPNVEVVYVATGANFADALAAGAAARGRGPVLLATRDGIPDATATELTRLRPRRIVVLGGTSAVAQSVQTSLAGYTTGSVSRVGGADRYATAANLSRSTYAAGVLVVYVATGTGFADALSAAALGAPVLLARPLCVPASTKAELDRLDPVRVVVLGGTAALSDDVRRLTVCR